MTSSPSTSTSALETPRVATCLRTTGCASIRTPSPGECTLAASKSPVMQPATAAAPFNTLSVHSSRRVNGLSSTDTAPIIHPSPVTDATMPASHFHSSATKLTANFSPLPHAHPEALNVRGVVVPREAVELEKMETQPMASRCSPSRKRSSRLGLNASPTVLTTAAAKAAAATNAGALDTVPDEWSSSVLQCLFRHSSASRSVEGKDDAEPLSSMSLLADEEGKDPDNEETPISAATSHPPPHQPRFVALREERVSICGQRPGFSVSPRFPSHVCPNVFSSATTTAKHSLTCSPVPGHLCSPGNVDAGSATFFMAVNHFSSAPEVQSWPRCSKVTSPFSFDINNSVDDGAPSGNRYEESPRSVLNGASKGSIAPKTVTAAPPTTRASAGSDTPTPTNTKATADVPVSVFPFAPASCTSTQSLYSTASATKLEDQPLSSNQVPPHVSASLQHRGSFSKGVPMSPSSLSTFAHTPLATSNAERSTCESKRQSVSGGRQRVAPSRLFCTHTGVPSFSSPSARMQRRCASEDVHGEVHDSYRGSQRMGAPPPLLLSCTLPSMLHTTANIGSGFSLSVPAVNKHYRDLSCDASGDPSVSDIVLGRVSPEQEGTQSHPLPSLSSLVSSLSACTECVVGEHNCGVAGGHSIPLSRLGSPSSSTNITRTQPLLVGDPTSYPLSQSIDPSSDRHTSVNPTQRTAQLHSSQSYPLNHSPACAQQPPTPEVDMTPIAVVSPTGLHHIGASEASAAVNSGSDSQKLSTAAKVQNQTDPEPETSRSDVTSTLAISSAASMAAVPTSVSSGPTTLHFSAGHLTAPISTIGNSLTSRPSQPIASGSHSKPHLQGSFVMRPDAEVLQKCSRGKVPRMPGCSMRDWAAHLSAKEEELRRQEKQHHSFTHPHGRSRGALYFGGATLPVEPASVAASRITQLPRMTPQDVALHNTPDDMWIVIHDVVYDCTVFQRYHPGGEKLLLACAGHDATAVYDSFHAWISCESFLAPYAVGVLLHSDSW